MAKSLFFYSNHFLEIMFCCCCVGQYQVNPLHRFFLLEGEWEENGSVCLEHKHCAGVSWCLALLCQKGDVHFPAPSVWVPMGFRDWNIRKLSHQSHAASLGVEEEQKGRSCWWKGAVATRVGRGQNLTSTSVLEWMRQCALISQFFQWDECWGDSVRARVTIILLYRGEQQAKSLSGFFHFPSCKLEEIFPKDAVKRELHWCCCVRDHVSPSERALSIWQLL